MKTLLLCLILPTLSLGATLQNIIDVKNKNSTGTVSFTDSTIGNFIIIGTGNGWRIQSGSWEFHEELLEEIPDSSTISLLEFSKSPTLKTATLESSQDRWNPTDVDYLVGKFNNQIFKFEVVKWDNGNRLRVLDVVPEPNFSFLVLLSTFIFFIRRR